MRSLRTTKIDYLSMLWGMLLLMVGTTAHAISVNYTYDNIGRLTQVTYPNNESITYIYDAAGNMLSSNTTIADADLDGIADAVDNCPSIANNDQLNNDNDTAGDACDADDDNDTITDVYELANGLDPFNARDANSDYDIDGLTALEEFAAGTRADLKDSDFDGDTDAEELAFGTDPNNTLDTIASHRPYAPVMARFIGVQDVNNVTLQSSAFSDPDVLTGDSISADQWQLDNDSSFATLELDRTRIGTEMSNNGTTLSVPNGLLNTNLTYYFRNRHRDTTGLWSDWSNGEILATDVNNALDTDADGVVDVYQVLTPTDVNNNGVDDNLDSIKVVYDAIYSAHVGIDLPVAGNPTGVITAVSALPVAQLPSNAILQDKVLPYGMFKFVVDVTAAGIDPLNPASVDVILHFPTELPIGSTWLKFDTITNQIIDYTDHVSFSGNTATLSLTDGGLGDLDKVVNGYIVDPGGPVLPINPDDVDNDGITNNLDNCSIVENPSQLDIDADGYGNYCDADFTNDGIVNALDLGLFKKAFFTFGDVVYDLNGDGVVNALDLGLFKQLFFKPPGPSGLVQ